MLDVLIVEDSAAIRELLSYIIASDPDLRVASAVASGEEALLSVTRLRPSVITMDIHLPGMDGFECTRRIMETQPTPVVVVSGSASVDETAWAFRALDAGALAVVPRPVGVQHPEFCAIKSQLLTTIKLMAEVKVVRRWHAARDGNKPASRPKRLSLPPAPAAGRPEIVAMGASTGGPAALRAILAELPATFPLPIVAVQHMTPGFVGGFAEWLGESCSLPVRLARPGAQLVPGVFIAPDDRHLLIGSGRRLELAAGPPCNGVRPSIDVLFESVAAVYGARAVGVLLTGMGRDGAKELHGMRNCGAVTIAQDRATSIVYGMPAAAVELGAATFSLNPAQIAALLPALAAGQPFPHEAKLSS